MSVANHRIPPFINIPETTLNTNKPEAPKRVYTFRQPPELPEEGSPLDVLLKELAAHPVKMHFVHKSSGNSGEQ
jgi:hypothetical protein